LFNLGGRFAAVENKCPHSGGPLCDGIVSGASVVCPLHGWRISLESGQVLNRPLEACVRVFDTKVENGVVLMDYVRARELRVPEVAA
jgi:nitrite reductase (NADH) small subunit